MYKEKTSIYNIAKILRRNMTGAEKRLWEELRNNKLGVKFRRQTPFIFDEYRYVADFCCYKLKLIIEIDGGIHDLDEIKEYDEFREEVFINKDYKVIRFKNDEVLHSINEVIKRIKEEINHDSNK